MAASKDVLIQVSPTFHLPSVYTIGTVAECEEALLLGAFVQQHVCTQRASGDIKVIQEQAKKDLAVLKVAKDNEIATAYKELQIATGIHQKAIQDAVRAAKRETRDEVVLEMQELVEKAHLAKEAAEERKRLLETDRAKDIQAAEDRTRSFLQQTLAIREEQVRGSQEALKALEQAYKAQVDELRSLNDFVRRKTQNVKVKGNEFEEAFRDHLLRAYGILDGFKIADTSKSGIGHAGDFLVDIAGHTTLWEVKHYDKVVQKSEVDKFRRDMLENTAVQVGVMVSKSTDIVGKVAKGQRELEFVEGKLLVYVSRFETYEDPVDFLQAMLPLFQIWWEVQREDETAEVFTDTLKELERLLTDLTRKRTEWRVHRSRLEETTRWMAEVVEDAETRVESLLRLMRAGKATDVEIPEGIFRSQHADERVRETITVILQSFEASTSAGDLRLTDIADVLAAKKSLAKTTARQHVLAALQDGVVVAAPGKPTLVRGLCPRKL